MPTKVSREELRSWPIRATGVPYFQMGVVRLALVVSAGATVLVATACSTETPSHQTSESYIESEPPRVPDPPPRYKKVDLDAGIELPPENSGEPQLQIKCGGATPYVCPLDDGTFACSALPCIPGCDRVGCLGGDVCMACDGGFRCVTKGGGC